MKHPPFYVIKILQDTDLSHSRRIEVAIDILKLSKEELQQRKQDEEGTHPAIKAFIDEILGDTPRTLQQAHERLESWKKKGEN